MKALSSQAHSTPAAYASALSRFHLAEAGSDMAPPVDEAADAPGACNPFLVCPSDRYSTSILNP